MKKAILFILLSLIINNAIAQDSVKKGKRFLYIGDSITDGN
jgi:hypothetical protein